MAEDVRDEIIVRWYRRSNKTKDYFDQFFFLWIAILVAARSYTQRTGEAVPLKSDRQFMRIYFRRHASQIERILSESNEARKLAQREGTKYGDPVIDIDRNAGKWKEYRERNEQFAKQMLYGGWVGPHNAAESFAHICMDVRNNLFHGEKVYNSKNDLELLELINPLLVQVLESCEGNRLSNRSESQDSFS